MNTVKSEKTVKAIGRISPIVMVGDNVTETGVLDGKKRNIRYAFLTVKCDGVEKDIAVAVYKLNGEWTAAVGLDYSSDFAYQQIIDRLIDDGYDLSEVQ